MITLLRSMKRPLFIIALGVGILSVASMALAASRSNFQQTITAGAISVDIVDNASSTVSNPSVAFNSVAFSFECNTSTGTFGTVSEQIYISNPNATAGAWSVSLAAENTTSVWDGAASDFDFNDPQTGGCADGGSDTDSLAGQMTVNPGAGVITPGPSGASIAGISLGSSASFVEGSADSLTLVAGGVDSADIGDWGVKGIAVTQTIPPSQPAAADYDIYMVLSIVAT